MAPRAGLQQRRRAYCSASALLVVLAVLSTARGAAGEKTAVVMSADGCGDEDLYGQVRKLARDGGLSPLSPERVGRAVARVRSARALKHARELYIGTDFRGCASLLAISEAELSRSIGDPLLEVRNRAHGLLAEINLWLGVCQWLCGDNDAARVSFRRSARLPSPPLPDRGAFPPEVVTGYRESVRAPTERVRCSAEALRKAQVRLVDGREVSETDQGVLLLDEGQHYIVWGTARLSEAAGPSTLFAGWVELERGQCRLDPKASQPLKVSCVSPEEAADPAFSAEVCDESGATTYLTVGYQDGSFSARMARARSQRFYRQLTGTFAETEAPAKTVARSVAGLLAQAGHMVPGYYQSSAEPWYGKWWVWSAAAVVALSVGVTVVAVTR